MERAIEESNDTLKTEVNLLYLPQERAKYLKDRCSCTKFECMYASRRKNNYAVRPKSYSIKVESLAWLLFSIHKNFIIYILLRNETQNYSFNTLMVIYNHVLDIFIFFPFFHLVFLLSFFSPCLQYFLLFTWLKVLKWHFKLSSNSPTLLWFSKKKYSILNIFFSFIVFKGMFLIFLLI